MKTLITIKVTRTGGEVCANIIPEKPACSDREVRGAGDEKTKDLNL
jgi:hypothetical protein